MAIIVVGGSSRGSGKTSLVCGLISALKEFSWNAVKITTLEPAPGSHSTLRPIPQQAPDSSTVHSQDNWLWEETRAGEENDTERYLAAGAARSFLAIPSTTGDPPTPRLGDLLNELWPHFGRGSSFIFESNSVVHHVHPNVCLMIHSTSKRALRLPDREPSFVAAVSHADAMVAVAEREELIPHGISLPSHEPIPVFYLTDLGRVSLEMLEWVRLNLRHG
jgi:hypothetical protein